MVEKHLISAVSRPLINPVVNCCHVPQEKEVEEHANESKEPDCKTREESHAQQTSAATEEAGQEKVTTLQTSALLPPARPKSRSDFG